MHDLLAAVVACARSIVEARRAAMPLDSLAERAGRRFPRGTLFRERLARPGRVNIIAECKRRSPARGVLAREYQPAQIAARYEAGGAAAISVLTESCFFDGDLTHLEAVRASVDVPILRKDFIVDEYQLHEARASGADGALLIVAALGQDVLERLLRSAGAMGLATLVEAHSPDEARRAADAGAELIGVNSRNLHTLEVDVRLFDEVLPALPPGAVAVAESGLRSVADVRRLRALGYSAFLIGEWLMREQDPADLMRRLTEEVTS